MTDSTTIKATPVWVDMAAGDVAAAGAFYGAVLGWEISVSDNPEYGGYAMGLLGGRQVAGIGGKQAPEQPTAWSVYIGTDDADALATRVSAAGGSVVVAPFLIGDQGRMAVFADPAGAVISAWEPAAMAGFTTGVPGAFSWAELNTRELDRTEPFYTQVFGWGIHHGEMGGGQTYTEFQVDGESVAGGTAMSADFPPEVPNYWLVYFAVDDVDAAVATAVANGAKAIVPGSDFAGGRFAVLLDPEGATFGLLRTVG